MANKTLQYDFRKAWEAMMIKQWHFFTESGKSMDAYGEVLKEMEQPEKGFIHGSNECFAFTPHSWWIASSGTARWYFGQGTRTSWTMNNTLFGKACKAFYNSAVNRIMAAGCFWEIYKSLNAFSAGFAG